MEEKLKEKYMKEALKEAKKALDKEEVPVGAIIVKDGKIVARAHNVKETKKDALCHAEIIAIERACKKLNSWRLIGCELYVTLEPCPMCAGALINSRIDKVYIGTDDDKTGACGSVLNLLSDYKFNHNVEIDKYILKEECEKILKDFFKYLRARNKNKKVEESEIESE
ncbi:MAG: tRNA adenosine(34) deaminase TadA [Clostridia bacterium]|nr:tRNA adenosine(34) deaminase TadA [Clostridia bacterium]